MQGKDGPPGPPGPAGDKGSQVGLFLHYIVQWSVIIFSLCGIVMCSLLLYWLKGLKGDVGPKGVAGVDGEEVDCLYILIVHFVF